MEKENMFEAFAKKVSSIAGSPYSFLGASILVIIWACLGPVFGYSDTWQLVINTGTTIITFLMVFVIQNTQNKDTAALHLKLDELIRVTRDAQDDLINLEEMSAEELEKIRKRYSDLAQEAHRHLSQGKENPDKPSKDS
jgi:low affinity Fe/Cu permease